MGSTTPDIAHLLENNATFVKTYQVPPMMNQIRGLLLSQPHATGSAVLTCVDPRVVPEKFFGPDMQSPVIRNAGGRVSEDVIRSIVLLRSLGNVKSVLVIHHTDCGVTHLTNDGITKDAKARTPAAAEELKSLGGDYGCYHSQDYKKSVEEDVLKLRNVKALEGMNIVGMGLDTPTGKVTVLDV